MPSLRPGMVSDPPSSRLGPGLRRHPCHVGQASLPPVFARDRVVGLSSLGRGLRGLVCLLVGSWACVQALAKLKFHRDTGLRGRGDGDCGAPL